MICYDCTRSTSGHCWRHYVNAAAGNYSTYTWLLNSSVANNAAAQAPAGWNPSVWVWWNKVTS